MPTPEELANFCAKCADDKLAENVKVIAVGAVSSIADYYVIATANSEPQLHALCSELERRVRDEYKLHPARTDGVGTGGWNLIPPVQTALAPAVGISSISTVCWFIL